MSMNEKDAVISIDYDDIIQDLSEQYLEKKLSGIDIESKLRDCLNRNPDKFSIKEITSLLRILDGFQNSGNFVTDKTILSSKRRAEPLNEIKKYNQNVKLIENNINNILLRYPKHQFLFVTLTLKNCKSDEISKTLKHFNHSISKLFKRKGFRQFINAKEYESGYLKVLEIDKSDTCELDFNVHCHLVLHLPSTYFKGGNYISQKRLAELWQSVTGVDYLPRVHIKKLKDEGKVIATLKYCVKLFKDFYDGIDLDDEEELLSILKFLTQIKYKRFLNFNGTLKELLQQTKNNNIIDYKIIGKFDYDKMVYSSLV